MNQSQKNARKINKFIIKESESRNKLVVAIDGYTGSGKTTIAKELKKINKNIEIIHLDDFVRHWKVRSRQMAIAEDKPSVFEYEWYRYEELKRIIKKFKAKTSGKAYYKHYNFRKNEFNIKKKVCNLTRKVLVVDGIFLIHPKHNISKFFDKYIYLTFDHAKADLRRQKRDKKQFGNRYLSDDHPENWVNHFKVAYSKYIFKYKPEKRADLVI